MELATMSWTTEDQARLNHLRSKELAGMLTDAEQGELPALMARVEAEEAQIRAPAMAQLRAEVGSLEKTLDAVRGENEELARLLAQQQSLAADARRFLAELDRRQAAISDALARLGPGLLPAT
jgi:chromosome segregation ATPase